MKSGRKEVTSKRSSREESKKPTSQSSHVSNIKKISCSIPLNMPTSIASKSVILNSHRPSKNSTAVYTKHTQGQPLTSQHSRCLSSHLENFPSSRTPGRKALLSRLQRIRKRRTPTFVAIQPSAKNKAGNNQKTVLKLICQS